MELLLVAWLVFGIASAVVASNRGGSGCLWFGLGILLGPIGFALAFTEGTRCSQCEKRISKKAAVCPYCGKDFRQDTELKQPGAIVLREDTTGMKKCPYCAENIKVEAVKCRYCGSAL